MAQVVPVISLIATIGGTAAAAYGTYKQYKGQKDAKKAQDRAEKIRANQMELESRRERRAAVRQSLIAQGQATNSAASQGASESSGIIGGISQEQNQAASNIGYINTKEGMGEQMFSANRQLSNAQGKINSGQGWQSLGNAIGSSADKIGRLGGYTLGKASGRA